MSSVLGLVLHDQEDALDFGVVFEDSVEDVLQAFLARGYIAPGVEAVGFDGLVDRDCEVAVLAEIVLERAASGRVDCGRAVFGLTGFDAFGEFGDATQVFLVFDSSGAAGGDDFVEER